MTLLTLLFGLLLALLQARCSRAESRSNDDTHRITASVIHNSNHLTAYPTHRTHKTKYAAGCISSIDTQLRLQSQLSLTLQMHLRLVSPDYDAPPNSAFETCCLSVKNEMSQYRAYFVPRGMDPMGLDWRDDLLATLSKALEQVEIPWQLYHDEFLEDRPGLSGAQKTWFHAQLAQGCVGATVCNLGIPGVASLDYSNCYKTREQAEARMKKMKCGVPFKSCVPRIFSTHFWNDKRDKATGNGRDVTFDHTGKADFTKWDQSVNPTMLAEYKEYLRLLNLHRNNPATNPAPPAVSSPINFDYGFLGDDGRIIHANHLHNPDVNPKDGVGDIFPNEIITGANGPLGDAVIFSSTVNKWKENYRDFNAEIWCVQCTGIQAHEFPKNP